MKDWYNRNYKTLVKEIKVDINKWETSHVHGLLYLILLMLILPKVMYRINALYQNPNDIFFCRIRKKHFKIHMKSPGTPNRQNNLEKEEQSCTTHTS